MRIIAPRGTIRTLGFLAIVAVPILGAIDGGSVVYSRMATEHDAPTVAAAAAAAVRGMPITPDTAVIAYRAAGEIADRLGATVQKKDFRVNLNGGITLTLTRTASTLVFDHLPRLRDLVKISSTVTVQPSPFT
jgi:hypothetical protein